MLKRSQFEIWLVDLNLTKGPEQKGIRPCVILETNGVNSQGQTTLIAPLTSQLNRIFSYEVVLPANAKTGLNIKSKIKMRQIRVIDISRLIKKIGDVPDEMQQNIRDNISIVFDLDGIF